MRDPQDILDPIRLDSTPAAGRSPERAERVEGAEELLWQVRYADHASPVKHETMLSDIYFNDGFVCDDTLNIQNNRSGKCSFGKCPHCYKRQRKKAAQIRESRPITPSEIDEIIKQAFGFGFGGFRLLGEDSFDDWESLISVLESCERHKDMLESNYAVQIYTSAIELIKNPQLAKDKFQQIRDINASGVRLTLSWDYQKVKTIAAELSVDEEVILENMAKVIAAYREVLPDTGQINIDIVHAKEQKEENERFMKSLEKRFLAITKDSKARFPSYVRYTPVKINQPDFPHSDGSSKTWKDRFADLVNKTNQGDFHCKYRPFIDMESGTMSSCLIFSKNQNRDVTADNFKDALLAPFQHPLSRHRYFGSKRERGLSKCREFLFACSLRPDYWDTQDYFDQFESRIFHEEGLMAKIGILFLLRDLLADHSNKDVPRVAKITLFPEELVPALLDDEILRAYLRYYDAVRCDGLMRDEESYLNSEILAFYSLTNAYKGREKEAEYCPIYQAESIRKIFASPYLRAWIARKALLMGKSISFDPDNAGEMRNFMRSLKESDVIEVFRGFLESEVIPAKIAKRPATDKATPAPNQNGIGRDSGPFATGQAAGAEENKTSNVYDLGECEIADKGVFTHVFIPKNEKLNIFKVPKNAPEYRSMHLRGYKLAKESLGGLAARTTLLENVTLIVNGEERFCKVAFVQERVTPLSKIIPTLPLDKAKEMITSVIRLEEKMIKRGVLNKDHDLLDGYGVNPEGNVVIFDFSHLLDDPSERMDYTGFNVNNLPEELRNYYRSTELDEVGFALLWGRGKDQRKELGDAPIENEATAAGAEDDKTHLSGFAVMAPGAAMGTLGYVILGIFAYLCLCVQKQAIITWFHTKGYWRLERIANTILLDLSWLENLLPMKNLQLAGTGIKVPVMFSEGKPEEKGDEPEPTPAVNEARAQEILKEIGFVFREGETLRYTPVYEPRLWQIRSQLTPSDYSALFDYFWNRSGTGLAFPKELKAKLIPVWWSLPKCYMSCILNGSPDGGVIAHLLKMEIITDEEEQFLWKLFHLRAPAWSNRSLAELRKIAPRMMDAIDAEIVRAKRPVRVLELGCGPKGQAIRDLKSYHGDKIEVFGVDWDIPDENIEGVTLKQANIRDLPFADNFFDLIYEYLALDALTGEPLKKSISEAIRVLAPGGKLIISQSIKPEAIRPILDSLGIDYEITEDEPFIITKKATSDKPTPAAGVEDILTGPGVTPKVSTHWINEIKAHSDEVKVENKQAAGLAGYYTGLIKKEYEEKILEMLKDKNVPQAKIDAFSQTLTVPQDSFQCFKAQVENNETYLLGYENAIAVDVIMYLFERQHATGDLLLIQEYILYATLKKTGLSYREIAEITNALFKRSGSTEPGQTLLGQALRSFVEYSALVAVPASDEEKIREVKGDIQKGKEVIVFFTCAFNQQRSALAEVLSKYIVRRLNLSNVTIFSGGTTTMTGVSFQKESAEMCIERGVDRDIVDGFSADPIRIEILDKSDVIFVSDPRRREILLRQFPQHASKIVYMSKLAPSLWNQFGADMPDFYSWSTSKEARKMPEEKLSNHKKRYFDFIYNALLEGLFGSTLSGEAEPAAGAVAADEKEEAYTDHDTKVLSDLLDKEELPKCLLEMLVGLNSNNKVVFAFDEKLAKGRDGKPFQSFLKAIDNLKNNKKYEKILQNLIIIPASVEKIPALLKEYKGQKHTKVFTFAREIKEAKDALSDIEKIDDFQVVYINENKMPEDAYYPLAEIVTITLAQAFAPGIINADDIKSLIEGKLKIRLAELNIDTVRREGKALIFTLLLDAKKMNYQQLIKRYAELKRFLKSA
ncbi:MAG: methyltransferase domain-containing protein [Candidatus Omnitrophota bacterium]